jgi:hypothetical protein
MKVQRGIPHLKLFAVAALSLAAAGALACQSTAPNQKENAGAAGFREFSERVQDYVKLQRKVESKLPPMLKSTELPEMIEAHQQALARKIREARPGAKEGGIFTHSACEAFRRVIREAFEGAPAAEARIPMGRAIPLKEMHLQVNGVYPDAVPYTAVPPTLLAGFPKLPDDVAYRVVQRDLVLIDVKSGLVVDMAHELLPLNP